MYNAGDTLRIASSLRIPDAEVDRVPVLRIPALLSPGTLWTANTQSFRPQGTLRTGGTRSFWPPRYPVDWRDSVLSATRYPVDWRDSVLSAPRYPVDWRDSVLLPPQVPCGLSGLSRFSPPGTLWTESSKMTRTGESLLTESRRLLLLL